MVAERVAPDLGVENGGERGIIEKIKSIGIKGDISIPPKKIDTSILSIDEEHIYMRKHQVSKEEAINFIKEAKVSFSAWKGKYEKYFSVNGATYVDVEQNLIKTSFKANEYDKKTKELMEVFKNG